MPDFITSPTGYKIPKTWDANLKWRQALLASVHKDRGLQKALYEKCRYDVLLWVNLCGWLYEPRGKGTRHKAIPFITFPFQDEALLVIEDAVTSQHDLLIEKSRDEGATWMCLYVFLHHFIFDPLSSFMLGSRNKDLVYKKDDYDALFTKVEWAIKHLPDWMQPTYSCIEMHMMNKSNGAVMDGAAATGNMGRGGRRTAILMDEFAAFDVENPGSGSSARNATADNSLCRIFNSTPQGEANEFFRIRIETDIKRLTLHWSSDPRKNQGIYYDEEGKPRSPWYDTEEKRRGSKKRMAQEVDIDYAAAGGLWFDLNVLKRVREEHARPPLHVGTLVYDTTPKGRVENVRWVEMGEGSKWRLWMNLTPTPEGERPSQRYNYVLGGDVATGSERTPSVLSVGNTTTKAKVAEYADASIPPEEFGRVMVAAAMFFGGQLGYGYLIWEANGVGAVAGNEVVLKQGYRYLYFREQIEEDVPALTRTHKGGWVSTDITKKVLMGRYRAGLARDELLNPCEESIRECEQYVEDKRGVPVAGVIADQSGTSRQKHGDRVIADALMFWGFELQPKASVRALRPPALSFAGRLQAMDARRKQGASW